MPESSSSRRISHKWHEISDLPEDLESFRNRELESLEEVWAERKQQISVGQVEVLNAQLAREWAIETGIIEDVYTLTRGITQTLIERGIDSAFIPHDSTNRDPELLARIIQGHHDVLEGLFAFVKGERQLTVGYIKELHQGLLRYQDTVAVFDQLGQAFEKPLEKGRYKLSPNNPQTADGTIHEYCPPEHVASEMDRLVQLHREHDQRGVAAYLEAAWLHHAFTQIHPFQDGNGRVARAIATLVFVKSGFFPLVVNRDDRTRYIDALESADRGDLSNLVRLFSQIQARALTKAISSVSEIKPVSTVEQAVYATREMLVDLGRISPDKYLAVKGTADILANLTERRLQAISSALTVEISRANPVFTFGAGSLDVPPSDQLRVIGEKFKYDPNASTYHRSATLTLTNVAVTSEIVVSLHGIGPAFRGVLIAVAYFRTGDGQPVPLSQDPFRISYQESHEASVNRYSEWLEACLIEGLAQWRRTLA